MYTDTWFIQKGQFTTKFVYSKICCNLLSIKIWSSHFRMTSWKRGWQLDNSRLTDLWKQLRFKQELVDQKTNKRADREREGRYSTLIINIIRRSFEISGCDFLGLEYKIQEELFIYLNKYLLLLLDTAPLALLLHFLHRSITALIMPHAATSSSDLAILHATGSKGLGWTS